MQQLMCLAISQIVTDILCVTAALPEHWDRIEGEKHELKGTEGNDCGEKEQEYSLINSFDEAHCDMAIKPSMQQLQTAVNDGVSYFLCSATLIQDTFLQMVPSQLVKDSASTVLLLSSNQLNDNLFIMDMTKNFDLLLNMITCS